MFENDDDEFGFWANVPDGRFARFNTRRGPRRSAPAPTTQRVRHHDDAVDRTQQIPLAAATQRVRAATEHVDPLLRRLGALALAIAVLVPVAMTLRSGDSNASVKPQATDLTLPAGITLGSDASVGQIVAAESTETSAAGLDPYSLPPAIPVVQDTVAATVAPATAPATSPKPAAKVAASTTVATQPARSVAVVKTQSVCAKNYTVGAGDAWVLIAKRFGVPTKDLLAANNASTATALYPKQQICLPANATAPAVKTTATKSTTAPAKSTPTTVKTTTTTAKPAPPQIVYTKAQVTQIIRDVWPDDLEDEAIRIATRESNLVPTAKNYCCYGLFQIYFSVHKSWLAQMGVTSAAQLADPRVNALAALVLYNRAGSFAPWNL